MKKTRKTVIIAVAAICLIVAALSASEIVRTTAYDFIKTPVQYAGYTGLTVFNGPSALYDNPAGLSRFSHSDEYLMLSGLCQRWLADSVISSLGAIWHVSRSLSFGANLRDFYSGSFPYADEFGVETGRKLFFNTADLSLGGSFAFDSEFFSLAMGAGWHNVLKISDEVSGLPPYAGAGKAGFLLDVPAGKGRKIIFASSLDIPLPSNPPSPLALKSGLAFEYPLTNSIVLFNDHFNNLLSAGLDYDFADSKLLFIAKWTVKNGVHSFMLKPGISLNAFSLGASWSRQLRQKNDEAGWINWFEIGLSYYVPFLYQGEYDKVALFSSFYWAPRKTLRNFERPGL